jgi:2-iminobutanoate/2-iminopropanoate deaminase
LRREIIRLSDIPSSPLYSHAIRVGNVVQLSGIVAYDPKTGKVEAKSIQEQTRQSILNCEAVLKAAQCTLQDVVQVIVLLKEPQDLDGMNAEYAKFFPKDPPARAVAKLGVELPNILISIMMTAVKD